MEKREITIILIILIIGAALTLKSRVYGIIFFVIIALLELFSYILIQTLRKDFQWLITPLDKYPIMDEKGLQKFIPHGYDNELGWIRKPNTSKDEIGKYGKTTYHINKEGARANPGHEKLKKLISVYGDSFPFGRQVNDNETFQWHLSESTKTNVMNFAVGNYGIDQAFLRLRREYPKHKTQIVIMGVVPSTIIRILSIWKHYNEFGNIFGFKPRFIIKKGKLILIENPINNEKKFADYKKYLPLIQKYDFFYDTKFRKEMIHSPYLVSILSHPERNIPLIISVSRFRWFSKKQHRGGYPAPMKRIMDINLRLRYNLFTKDKGAVLLFEAILEEFKKFAKKHRFTPIFLFMPQKDDLLFIQKHSQYYRDFIIESKKIIYTIDLTDYLLPRKDLDILYSDDNQYGGHYSRTAHKKIAEYIYKQLKRDKVIS